MGSFLPGICKDAGYQATASQIELFCKLSVMVLSIPVLMALLETIQEFLGEAPKTEQKMAWKKICTSYDRNASYY